MLPALRWKKFREQTRILVSGDRTAWGRYIAQPSCNFTKAGRARVHGEREGHWDHQVWLRIEAEVGLPGATSATVREGVCTTRASRVLNMDPPRLQVRVTAE